VPKKKLSLLGWAIAVTLFPAVRRVLNACDRGTGTAKEDEPHRALGLRSQSQINSRLATGVWCHRYDHDFLHSGSLSRLAVRIRVSSLRSSFDR